MNELSSTEREIITTCGNLMREIAGRQMPEAWMRWDVAELEELRTNGPRYSPSAWFGDGRAVPDRIRVRYLRALQALEARVIVKCTNSDGGSRLAFVRLTATGELAFEELTGKPIVPSKAKPESKAKRSKRPTPKPANVDADVDALVAEVDAAIAEAEAALEIDP